MRLGMFARFRNGSKRRSRPVSARPGLRVECLESRQLLSGLLKEFNIGGNLAGVAPGPDGNLWFISNYEVGRITPNGHVDYFGSLSGGSANESITAGPDGNMWFVTGDLSSYSFPNGNSVINRITPNGVRTSFTVPTPQANVTQITLGPDGNLWFTESGAHKIGKITPSGDFTEFTGSNGADFGEVNSITAGPDGNLWFTTSRGAGAIGRITTDGHATLFPLPDPPGNVVSLNNAGLSSITAGPDGNLWFTETNADAIGKITTDGVITTFPIPVPPPTNPMSWFAAPTHITTGVDGNLWFTETTNAIGRITPSGQFTPFGPFDLPFDYGYNHGVATITSGPDGNLWFTAPNNGQIVQFSPNDETIARGVDERAAANLDDSLIVATYVTHGDPTADSATIDWGDGTTSAATFDSHPTNSASDSQVVVSGNHVYAHTGVFTVSVSINNGGHAQSTSSTVTVVASAAITATGASASSAVGLPNTATYVAEFTSADIHARADSFTATIDWGDGVTTPAIVEPKPDDFNSFFSTTPPSMFYSGYVIPAFVVSGDHVYTHAGHFTPHVNIIDLAHDAAAVDSSVSVAPPETLTATSLGYNVQAFPGQQFQNTTIAHFNDSAPGLNAEAFTATIDWGDGTTSAGTVQSYFYVDDYATTDFSARPSSIVFPQPQPGSNFAVVGSHAYAAAGNYTIHVTITSLSGASTDVSSSALIDRILPQLYPISSTTNAPISTASTLGSVLVQNANASPGDYTAVIDWGDGTTSAAALVNGYTPTDLNGHPLNQTYFSVQGSHVYSHAGSYTVTLSVTDSAHHTANATGTATIVDETLTPFSQSLTTPATVPLNALDLGEFTDNRTPTDPSDFTAVISWGDGTTSTGSIVREPIIIALDAARSAAVDPSLVIWPGPYGPRYGVLGSHTYATVGDFTVTITVTSTRGPSTTIQSHIHVTPAPLEVIKPFGTTFFATAGAPISANPRPVATFNGSLGQSSEGSYAVAIDWGDGTPLTPGTVESVASVASFASGQLPVIESPEYAIVGNHTYAQPGLYRIHVTIIGGNGGTATIDSGVDIVPATPTIPTTPEVIAPVRSSVTTNVGNANTPHAVASFLDSDPGATAGDFTATIQWGDGSKSTQGVVTSIATSPGASGLVFIVSGAHRYSRAGHYNIHVTITRNGGPTATTQSTATVKPRKALQVVNAHPRGPAAHPAHSRTR
jgi:streptogramin lyase